MKNKSLYMPVLDNTIRMIDVVFGKFDKEHDHKKHYTYKCDLPNIDVGDVVIVETYNWFSVARVVAVDLPIPITEDDIVYRWVAAKFNEHAHDLRVANEEQVIRSIEKKRVDATRAKMLEALGITDIEARTLIEHADERINNDAVVIDDADKGDDC